MAQSMRSAVLLDADRIGQAPDRDVQIAPLAARLEVRLVWQRPCHEAVLLHHFPDGQALRPHSPNDAIAMLRRFWPHYEKAMPALRLGQRFTLADVRRACEVEPELRAMLEAIGYFLP
jgi:hypothetical protein